MNKKLLIIVAVVIVFLLILKIVGLSSANNKSSISHSSETNANISIEQQKLWVSIYSQTENNNSSVHLLINPFVNINLPNSTVAITKATIKNIHVSYNGPGEIKIIHPKHISRKESVNYYYAPVSTQLKPSEVKNESNTISYNIATDNYNPIANAYDEISKSGGYMEFKVAIQNIGSYNKESIKNKYGSVNSGKALQYINLDPAKLDGKITFVLELKLDNKKTFQKKFTGEWHGQDFKNSSTHTYELK